MHHISFRSGVQFYEIAHGFGEKKVVEQEPANDIAVADKQKIVLPGEGRCSFCVVENGSGAIDGLEKAGGGNGFYDIIGHGQFEGFYGIFFFGRGENDNGCLVAELSGEFDAAHAGHFDIEQEDIDRLFLQKIISIEGGGAIAGHAKVFDLGGQLFDGGAGHFVVIDDQAGHAVKVAFSLWSIIGGGRKF